MAFSFGASDILKLLEQIPIWKNLVGLPKRVAELEAQVKALQAGKSAQRGPGPTDCPVCGATMTFRSEKDDQHFGVFGVKVHRVQCDACNFEAERRWDPRKGGYTS